MVGEHDPRALVVNMGGRRYALPLADVAEVVRLVVVTPLPDPPPGVAGAINVRGRLVAVLDPERHLSSGEEDLRDGFIVLTNAGSRPVGLVVDSVEGVEVLAGAGSDDGSSALSGVARVGDAVVPLVEFSAPPARAPSGREVADARA